MNNALKQVEVFNLAMDSQIADESGIGASYRGEDKARTYVEQRFVSELMSLLHERQVEAINRVMREERPSRSLEVAPGPGRLTRDVAPSGKLICLEFNEGMICEGKRHCKESVQWRQGNAFELPFDEGDFDFAYSFRFIRHFHRADRQRLYSQLHRVLRPEGILVFDAVNAQVSLPLRLANPNNYPIYDKLYDSQYELKRELTDAGFEVLRIVPVQKWFHAQSKAQNLLGPRSRKLCRWAVRGLERMRRGPALEWIITCRRA